MHSVVLPCDVVILTCDTTPSIRATTTCSTGLLVVFLGFGASLVIFFTRMRSLHSVLAAYRSSFRA
jgi:hypothetical protein